MKKLLWMNLFSILLALLFSQPAAAQDKPPCADAGTQSEINQCMAKEYKKADAELNKVYQQVLAKASAGEKAKLRTAQLAWIKFRDAECDFESAENVGGSIYPTVVDGCKLALSAARTKHLRDFQKERDAR